MIQPLVAARRIRQINLIRAEDNHANLQEDSNVQRTAFAFSEIAVMMVSASTKKLMTPSWNATENQMCESGQRITNALLLQERICLVKLLVPPRSDMLDKPLLRHACFA